jgi:ferric-dicitrate binding protein FerR (iron transport regulator)
MRKAVVILALLLAPTAVWAQGTLRVLSVRGPVEWKAAAGRSFVPVAATNQPSIQVGDELRTGPNAEIYLGVPDGSYVVVSENSKFTVQDFWSGNLKSIMNLMMGQVHFYIKKLGGQPNPYSVTTPTALIAVRGTIFDVIVDSDKNTEVQCTEGQVKVENIAGDEVILDRGFKTLVRPGERPFMPVPNDTPINKNRLIAIHPKKAPKGEMNGNGAADILAHDNDRGNRISNPAGGSNSNSGTIDNTQRAKPTLTFP